MPQYVALLRGIGPTNPNMRNEKLRGVLEKLNFKNVRTVISSGNVLFESESKNIQKLEEMIEEAWPAQLGFTSTTIVRSIDQLKALIKKDPFRGFEDIPKSRWNVTFFKKPTDAKVELPYKLDDDSYQVLGMEDQAVFTVVDLSGTKIPAVMSWLEKQFGKQITTRTWKTVVRIVKALG